MSKKSIFDQLKASANGNFVDKKKRAPKNNNSDKEEDITYKFAGYVLSNPDTGFTISKTQQSQNNNKK
uniref:Lipoprotein n=1 Tax=Strongyloides papillosus TaxID=174720 RepID=A0A0N5CC37_STREA